MAVADYRRMLIQELSGQQYNKTEHRRALQKLLDGRSEGSIERKHQDSQYISPVVCDFGQVLSESLGKLAWQFFLPAMPVFLLSAVVEH